MGRSNLRSIRRLKADAAPVFAELDRRESEWKKSLPSLAEDHMLRVVAVFRYGGPRIDEALAHARGRACSKLEIYNCNDSSLSNRMRTILQGEPPNKSIRSKIFACVPKMPDWLRYLCAAHISMRMLGFKLRPLSPDMFRLHPAQADIRAWPSLPKGMLEAHSVPGRPSFVDKMLTEELVTYMSIRSKPEDEWTRHERQFINAMLARDVRRADIIESLIEAMKLSDSRMRNKRLSEIERLTESYF